MNRIFAFCFLLQAFLFSLDAAVYYVSPGGDGSDPTAGFPTGYSDIAAAVAASSAGDTVILDKATFLPSSALVVDKAITITGAGEPHETVYDGQNQSRPITVTASGALLKNFTFTRVGAAWDNGIGIKMTGNSVLSNLVARQNGNAHSGNARYAFILDNGILSSSYITNNYAPNCPGIALGKNAIVENCYIRDNMNRGQSSGWQGSAISGNGTVRNCTIIDNRGNTAAIYGAVKLQNSIVYGNKTADGSTDNNYFLSDMSLSSHWTTNCISPSAGIAGAGNFDDDPLFANDKMHLSSVSPCIGRADKETSPKADLEGMERGSSPSLGCMEYKVLDEFMAIVSASSLSANHPAAVTLSVFLEGSHSAPVSYEWDFDSDGTVDSTEASPVLSEIGLYAPSVKVTDASGRIAAASMHETVIIYSESGNAYVTNEPNPNAAPPYATWETATTSIQDAVYYCMPGAKVVLSPGLHNASETVSISKPVTVTSIDGRKATSPSSKKADPSFSSLTTPGRFSRRSP